MQPITIITGNGNGANGECIIMFTNINEENIGKKAL
jgi:hypothetical protein